MLGKYRIHVISSFMTMLSVQMWYHYLYEINIKLTFRNPSEGSNLRLVFLDSFHGLKHFRASNHF